MNQKIKIFTSTVLRKSTSGQLFLMNKKEQGWASKAIPINCKSSLDEFLNTYDVVLGKWSRDQFGEYIEVIPSESYIPLPTFDAFMASAFVYNSYINDPEFDHLYVRRCGIFVNKEFKPMICIANVKVTNTGNGVFTRFLKRIRSTYLNYIICVENVYGDRFRNKLERLGFTKKNDSYYLAPDESILGDVDVS
jgi:hypothetical protein